MKNRLQHFEQTPELAKIIMQYGQQIKTLAKPNLFHLIDIRASQINGCAFCLDMHVKQAKMDGESELKLLHVSVWRESNLFSKQECAVLELTEALTKVADAQGLGDDVYEKVRAEFSDKEIAALTHAICCINVWNRLNAVSCMIPGSMDKMLGVENSGLHA